MRTSPLRFSILLLGLLTSCATLRVRTTERRTPTLPPEVLTELEIGRVRLLYDNLPDFVAYGKYTITFMFNRNKGTFRMYKLSDTIYVKLDDNRTFVIPWDSIMNVKLEDGRMEIKGDTIAFNWDGNDVVLINDNLAVYRGHGIVLKLENYAYDPIPHPRRIVLRSMGVSVILMVDSIKPLP